MNYIDCIEKVKNSAKSTLSVTRYEHSVRVAELCARLCKFFGMDEKKGYLAGIGHDICKEMKETQLLQIVKKAGFSISSYEIEKPILLHGKAAFVALKETFSVDDDDVLEAVAVHVVGSPDMCDLAKCLYIADKVEPGRSWITDKYIENLFKMKLDEMLLFVLDSTVSHLLKKGYSISNETQSLLDDLRKKNEKN
ncbi:MAG: HD domain-containing protein [Treponema sp.]|jgi:predicted HD superfamily hydrolase involved in NAD metabolism|nr:HD domain-containing protein [Treponema sp.]